MVEAYLSTKHNLRAGGILIMVMVVDTVLGERIMVTELQVVLIALNVVDLAIGLGNALWVGAVEVGASPHVPGMVVVEEIVLEGGIVMVIAMMTAIVVVVIVKETVVLIVGTGMAAVTDMAMIVMVLIVIHRMVMERKGAMIVIVPGELSDMAVVVLPVTREATEKDQGPMIVQVGEDNLRMMIAIDD